MIWRNPVIRHTEQLQSSVGTGGSGISASNRTAPQWQPPCTFIVMSYGRVLMAARRRPRGGDERPSNLLECSAVGGDENGPLSAVPRCERFTRPARRAQHLGSACARSVFTD